MEPLPIVLIGPQPTSMIMIVSSGETLTIRTNEEGLPKASMRLFLLSARAGSLNQPSQNFASVERLSAQTLIAAPVGISFYFIMSGKTNFG
jgi:hypothetical protein